MVVRPAVFSGLEVTEEVELLRFSLGLTGDEDEHSCVLSGGCFELEHLFWEGSTGRRITVSTTRSYQLAAGETGFLYE